MNRFKEIADRIGRWVASGGTQTTSGAFCGWYDVDTGRLSAPYPEITGYVVGFLATSSQPSAEQAPYVARAAASWLVSRWRHGDRSARPEKTGEAVYTFDVAMQAHGLIRHGLATRDENAIAVGLEAADFLVALITEHNTLPAIVPGTASSASQECWSATGRPHLLKAVQSLLDAHELGVAGAASAAARLIKRELQDSYRVPPRTCRAGNSVSLHALCYAAEGLWIWGTYYGDTTALRRAWDIVAWLWQQRLPDGGFPGFVSTGADPLETPQADVTAQALRLASLLGFDAPLHAEATSLARGLWREGDHAAVFYRPGSGERHLNCWSSLFAAQALILCGGDRDLNWHELV